MKCLELLAHQPHISSVLAVRKVGPSLNFSLVTRDAPTDAALVGNFKPRLLDPDVPFWVSLPRANGTLEPIELTGRKCCEAFLLEISKLLRAQGRKIGTDSVLRFSEPPFPSAEERKAYQDTVRKAAKDAGLGGTISFFREPDAVFEYFRLLQRKIPPQGSSLNVLVLDFGGGTCNVSVVSTTRQGELWKRYIAAPIAAEASKAGGLHIDQQLLTQALLDAGLKHLYATGAKPEARRAYKAWVERHSSEAEALKRRVSEKEETYRIPVALDGALAEFAGGGRDLSIELRPQQLRDIVSKHWHEGGIREAVEGVLGQLRARLVKTAQRKDVPEDPKALITHVLVAGGSSQLPGFIDHVKQYFAPRTPEFVQVGTDYPYVVAVGTGLNHLSLNRALTDERAPIQLPAEAKGEQGGAEEENLRATDSTFIGAFQDDLCLFWHPREDTVPQLLVDSHLSPLDLLDKPKYQNVRLPGLRRDGYRHVRDQRYGYQVAYRNDEEAHIGLSGNRLNLTDHHLDFPPNLRGKQIQVRTCMEGEPGRSLEMLLEVLSPKNSSKPLSERRIPFLSKESSADIKVPIVAPPPVSPDTAVPPPAPPVLSGKLRTRELDVLCIDFGTTNTTLVDLSQASELTLERFIGTSTAEPLTPTRHEPIRRGQIAPEPPVELVVTQASPPMALRQIVQHKPLAPPPPGDLIPAAEPAPPPASPQVVQGLKSAAEPINPPLREAETLRSPSSPTRQRAGQPFAGGESAFIDHLDKTCRTAGFEYQRELLETFYLSLKVRPFVVLAGPSGVGKSALAQLMFEACGGSLDTNDALRLAVEAHWTDSRFLFGRRDAHGFHPTPLYQMLREAPTDRLYHVLLDEMNLAHVEYYFAQFLSAMESDGQVRVHEDETRGKPILLPRVDRFSLLRLYGTINVDESTQVLSDKVVDRVNVIEVQAQPPQETLSFGTKRERQPPAFHLPLEKLREWHRVETTLTVPPEIREIWDVMARHEPRSPQEGQAKQDRPRQVRRSIPLGHRIVQDITLFVHFAERLKGGIERKDAIDLQVKQRILPKIRGDTRLQEPLKELSQVLTKYQFHRSLRRLECMVDQLDIDQFVTFWA